MPYCKTSMLLELQSNQCHKVCTIIWECKLPPQLGRVPLPFLVIASPETKVEAGHREKKRRKIWLSITLL